jgi:hypothetical protein
MLSCRHEMSFCQLSRFAAYFPYAMSCFLAVMRCQFEIVCFLLNNYRTRYLDEMHILLSYAKKLPDSLNRCACLRMT